ncbi:MAG: type IV pilin protein [Chromatiales bacterium]|jgi:type IV pilus assembly protein PilE
MIYDKPDKHHQTGLTLIELLITVAIIAILSAIGYPLYNDYVTKSRRAEGKSTIMQVMQAQQRNYTANSTYATDLTALGYATATDLPSEYNYYLVTAGTCGASAITSCVRLTAVPQYTDDECGSLVYDSTGAKDITGTSTIDKCW